MKNIKLMLLPLFCLTCLSGCNHGDDEPLNQEDNNNQNEHLDDVDIVTQAINNLNSLKSHPCHFHVHQIVTSSNKMSDNSLFQLKFDIEGDTDIYRHQDKLITHSETNTCVIDENNKLGSPTSLVEEFSYDEHFMYQISVSDDPEIGSGCQKYQFDQTVLPVFLKTSYEATVLSRLDVLKSYQEDENFKCELTMSLFGSTSSWQLNYKMINYEQGSKVIKEVVSYETIIDIKDDIILSVNESCSKVGYGGGVAIQSMNYQSLFTFREGEYSSYPGTPLNPNDY